MSLIKYEVFNAVIEYGSLTKAAEALNLTQSAISYSISNLESELGFSL
ncbi:LysR family transcriptional regulator, partial [Priestia megaterium]